MSAPLIRDMPTVISRSLGSGAGRRAAVAAQVITDISTHQSNSVDAWEAYKDLSGSIATHTHSTIFRTRGDRTLGSGIRIGDRQGFGWLILHTNGFFYSNFFFDFSTVDDSVNGNSCDTFYGDGTDITGAGNDTPTEAFFQITDTDAVDYWLVVNEYGVIWIVRQSGSFFTMRWGSPIRSMIPDSRRFVCYSTGAVTSGASKTFNVDRDPTAGPQKITAGQTMHVMALTEPGNALETYSAEDVVVSTGGVTSTTITIDNLVSNKPAFTMLGLDPNPFFCDMVSGGAFVPNFTYRSDGATSQANNQGTVLLPDNGITEAEWDPGSWNIYNGLRGRIRMADGLAVTRGTTELQAWWAQGTQVDLDGALPNDDTTLRMLFFASLTFGSRGLAVGFGWP